MEKKPTKFSDIWLDDTKMTVLFAPFRDKSLNPSSWKQKMSFWEETISNECANSKTCIIGITSLQNKFSRNGKVPLCLDVVLEEMLRCNTLRKLTVNTNSPVKQKPSWLTWGYDTFLKTPVTWGISYLSTDQTSVRDVKYVVLDVLRKKCDDVIEQHYCGLYCDVLDSVIDYNELWKKSQSLCESETEFYLILEELIKQRKIAVHHENTQTLLKFCNRTNKTVKPVSKRDIDIFRIKKTRDMLTDRIDSLSADIDKLKKEALRLKKTSKTQALRCLRQKRIVEKRIDKLTGSVDILDNILDQITHSVSDDMVVKALESGNSVLKSLTERTSVDHVTDVMDELAEVLEKQTDIRDQLSSGPSGLDVSREELEAELDDMMRGDTEQKQPELSIDDIISGFSDLHLPNVPSSTSVVDIDVQSQSQLSPHRNIRNPVSTNTHQSPNSVPKTLSTSPVMIQSPSNVSRSPGTSPSQISQINLYKQSPVLDNLENMCRSSEELDLSLELPDVPSFTPTFDKHKREACLDT